MRKLLHYLPFHFLCFFMVGICFQHYFEIWKFGLQKLLLVTVSVTVIIFLCNFLKHKNGFSLSVWLFFVFSGIAVTYLNADFNHKTYYQHFLKSNSIAVLKITKVLKPSIYYHKYEAKVININTQHTRGIVLLNISKDSLFIPFMVDDEVLVDAHFVEINEPLNPHQFNYKKYLRVQGIEQQIFSRKDEYKRIDNPDTTLMGYAFEMREKIKKSLQKYNFSKDEFGVITALLLGQRQEISKELSDDYTNAGAIHILAVSGLHVGILLLVLTWLLKPLEYFKKGKLLKAVLIILFLWFFALLAGLSASVVRAVTMFTFLAVGNAFQSKKVIEFSLISSALLLLIIKPMFLFEVGFQLSYLAVFGIVWMQPKIYNFISSRFKGIDFFMQIISVSVAAQLAVLPLSLYYFHQFPSLFLVSNIVIIPVLGSILISGIFIITLAVLNILPNFLVDFFGWIISCLNQFIQFVSHQESYLFEDISMSFLRMLASYLLLILLFQSVLKVNTKAILVGLIGICCFQAVMIIESYHRNQKEEFIVFHQTKRSYFGKRAGVLFNVYSNSNKHNIPFLTNYTVGENVSISFEHKIPNYIKFKDKNILVVDSLGIYNLNQLNTPIVILINSPKINLERLILKLQPKSIIADGSNYKSYLKNWKHICDKEKIIFKYTGESGAIILD